MAQCGMVMSLVPWLLVAWLLLLLVSQNGELDFAMFSCSTRNLQQLYDALSFLFGIGGDGFLSSCTIEATRDIVGRCGVAAGDKVLELGFGTGRLAQVLLGEVGVKSYDGIELSEGMVNLTARRIGDSAGKRLHLHHSTEPIELLRSSWHLNSFSHTFALFLLDSVGQQEIEQILELVHERSRPEGKFCIAVLADRSDAMLVRLYKTLWRVFPLLCGGRRPLAMRRFFNSNLWSIVASWSPAEVWMPFEVFVLQKNPPDRALEDEADANMQHARVIALQLWASFLDAPSLESQSLSMLRKRAANCTDHFSFQVAKQLADFWLPQLTTDTVKTLIARDIQQMSKEDILDEAYLLMRERPSASLLEDLRSMIKSWDRSWLEEWAAPRLDNMTLAEMRRYIDDTIDSALEAASDVDASKELLQLKETAAKSRSRGALLEVYERLEREIIVPASEISRESLEAAVMDIASQSSREELEDEILASYDSRSTEELRAQLREEMEDMSRDDMLVRAQDALNNAKTQWLRSLVRDVALRVLTDAELELLAKAPTDPTNQPSDVVPSGLDAHPSGPTGRVKRAGVASLWDRQYERLKGHALASDLDDYQDYAGDYAGDREGVVNAMDYDPDDAWGEQPSAVAHAKDVRRTRQIEL